MLLNERLLTHDDIKRIAKDYGCDCELRWATFLLTIGGRQGKYHGYVAYLISPTCEISLGLWGALKQLPESLVRALIEEKLGQQAATLDEHAPL